MPQPTLSPEAAKKATLTDLLAKPYEAPLWQIELRAGGKPTLAYVKGLINQGAEARVLSDQPLWGWGESNAVLEVEAIDSYDRWHVLAKLEP